MKIVSLFQLSATSASSFTYQKGVNHATNAIACATALGQPNGSSIYFCVDYAPENLSIITEYFAGVYSVLINSSTNPNGYTMGVYGCAKVCKHIRSIYSGIKTMLWGTTNCYDGTNFTSWNIRQYYPEKTIGSGATLMNIDVCGANSPGFGDWMHIHSYKAWSNYGNPALHRRECRYCTKYDYAAHIPNATNTRCTVCGYVGNISSPASIDDGLYLKYLTNMPNK